MMKKVKQLFLKSGSAILVALLGIFGFSSCDSENGGGKLMYGTPQTYFSSKIVKGTVVNKETQQPIEGIEVRIVGTFIDARGNERISYFQPKKLTDEEGRFKLQGADTFLGNEAFSAAIHFSDIDGEKNGLFKNKTVGLDIENFEETKPPSGWFLGEFTKTMHVKLRPIMEDEEYDGETDE